MHIFTLHTHNKENNNKTQTIGQLWLKNVELSNCEFATIDYIFLSQIKNSIGIIFFCIQKVSAVQAIIATFFGRAVDLPASGSQHTTLMEAAQHRAERAN